MKRWRLAVVAGLAVLTLATLAHARPGGGDSFSGGGGGGGGGGNGDAILFIFELIYWILRLLIEFPTVGVPLIVIVVVALIVSAVRHRRRTDWDSAPAREPARAVDLGALHTLDPEFSQVVFEDFAFRLFSTAHRDRHSDATLAEVAPYVSADARQSLARRDPVGTPIAQVVVGAMRVAALALPARGSNRVRITLEYEANLATAARTDYTVERWVFARDADVHSKPPNRDRTFPCPNCGAPWEAKRSGTQVCGSCGEAVDNGRIDWLVERADLLEAEAQPPTLTTELPERGTDLPTYRHRDVERALGELTRDDPAVTKPALEARLDMIYHRLNTAWSDNALAPARGLVSDGLYDYLQYWVDAYRAQGLRNVLADMRITRTVIARVVRDRYFDAITLRIWATGKDFVIRTTTGERLRGSKTRDRAYSEYWTVIRSAGRRAAPAATATCGHCGAPLQISQSGECEHCGAHVTAGEFDWVLSKIEQDDTYRG
jgi:hypothetical protein